MAVCRPPSLRSADRGALVDGLQIELPNGTTCHLTSRAMRRTAKFLCWEIHTLQRYLHPGFELRPTDNVLDVGGNLGMFMLWAAPQVPQGRVVTVEPTPRAHTYLALNIEKNGFANVTALNTAIGRDGGRMNMVTYPGIEALSTAAISARRSWPASSQSTRAGRSASRCRRFRSAASWTSNG